MVVVGDDDEGVEEGEEEEGRVAVVGILEEDGVVVGILGVLLEGLEQLMKREEELGQQRKPD